MLLNKIKETIVRTINNRMRVGFMIGAIAKLYLADRFRSARQIKESRPYHNVNLTNIKYGIKS